MQMHSKKAVITASIVAAICGSSAYAQQAADPTPPSASETPAAQPASPPPATNTVKPGTTLPDVEVVQQSSTPQKSKPKKKVTTQTPVVPAAAPTPPAVTEQEPTGNSAYAAGSALGPTSGYAAPSTLSSTKTDTPLIETPQAVSVVTKDFISDRKAQDVSEALATVPGFYPGVDYLFEQAYSLRGFLLGSGSYYQKYKDGRRIPQVTPIATDLLERIDVIKGPSSVLYGQIEPGGLVNYVSKRAQIGSTGGYVQQDFSSFDQFKTIIDANVALGSDAAFRMPASFATGNSFRDYVEYESYDLAPSATWQLSPDTRVSLLTTLGRREKTDDTLGKPIVNGTTILDVPRSRFLGDPSFVNDITYGSVTAEIEHRISSDVMSRSAYSYFYADRHAEYALNGFFTPFVDPQLARFGGVQDDKFAGHSVYQDFIVTTPVLGLPNTFLFGVDALWSDRKNYNNIGDMSPINVNNPTYDPTIFPPFLFDDYRANVSSQQYGVYIQDQLTLLQDLPAIHKLTLTLGGRWDWANDDYNPSGLIFFAPVAPQTVKSDAFSPRAALLWMPTPEWSLYGSYSESFNPQDSERVTTGAPLDPTLATQYEIGSKYQLLPGLAVSFALFDITKTNIPGPDPTNPLLTALVGEVRSRGLELEIVGQIAPGWQVAAGYARIDTEITEDTNGNVGNRLLAAPDSTFGLWTGYTIQPGNMLAGLGFGAGVTYLSDVFNDNENLISISSHTIYDAAIWYRPNISYGGVTPEWSINVKNLTDEHYYQAGNGFSAVQDGAARTIIGSVKMSF